MSTTSASLSLAASSFWPESSAVESTCSRERETGDKKSKKERNIIEMFADCGKKERARKQWEVEEVQAPANEQESIYEKRLQQTSELYGRVA